MNEQDLHEEIQCRIDYFKQLCRDRQFVDQEMWHYYRGSASALNALLSYMERGINWDSLKDSDKKNSVEDSDLPKKIVECKEAKSRFISEAARKKF